MLGPTHKGEYWPISSQLIKANKEELIHEYIQFQLLPLSYINDALTILKIDGNNQIPYHGMAQREETQLKNGIEKDHLPWHFGTHFGDSKKEVLQK